MSSLYIDRKDVELKMDGQAIAFYENNQRCGTIPLAPIERIFLRGDITLHTNLLGKMGENGTGVVLMSGRKGKVSLLMSKPHNDAARRVTQYHLSSDSDFCIGFSRCIVESKINAQLVFLEELQEKKLSARYELTQRISRIREALSKIGQQENIPAIRGIEGNTAAQYFAGLAAILPESLHFSGRNRQPPRDPFNVVLSLGYTLLHAETVLALYGAGLDPYIGFYHALDFGRESLACDLVEAFRTDVDRFGLKLFNDRTLRPEDFTKTGNACMMGKTGRAAFYKNYEPFIKSIRRNITENISDICDVIRRKTDIIFPQTRQADAILEKKSEETPF